MSEEKRSEVIHDALHYLDDEIIEEVEELRGYVKKEEMKDSSDMENQIPFSKMEKQRSVDGDIPEKVERLRFMKSWRKWMTLAASFCVLIAGSWIYGNYIKSADMSKEENVSQQYSISEYADPSKDTESSLSREEAEETANAQDSDNSAEQEIIKSEDLSAFIHLPMQEMLPKEEEGITIPKMEVSLKKENEFACDMIGFFIHEGRCYVQYEYVKSGADFVGECVGTVEGLIDEWTPEDGYVDGAGTFTGKIYEVEGVDPEFMLCTVWDDGVVETYINNNGITLKKGSDLVDDRLHLRNNYKRVSFQTDEEYSNTLNEPIPLSEEDYELFDRFLDSFSDNDFAYVEGKSYYPFGGDLDNSHIYHLYFTTENGLILRFSLLGDGYVCFPWLNGVCVQIDQNIYDEVVEVLQENER